MTLEAGPVRVPLNNTATQLLAKLTVDLGTDDSAGVISRALGLLDLAVQARTTGRRLVLIDAESGRTSDVTY